MVFLDGSIEAFSENDLDELINNEVPESVTLDYKSALYDLSGSGRQELLKDVSSFANASGGVIIFGVDEKKGVPVRVCPLELGDSEQLILKIEAIIRTGIEPRLTGVRTRAVPVAGGHIFLIMIDKSWNPPHRVSLSGHNKFYVRNSSGKHEVDVQELRVLFTKSAASLQKARDYTRERLNHISKNNTIRKFGCDDGSDSGKLVIQLVPLAVYGMVSEFLASDLQANRNSFHDFRLPSASFSINIDGLCLYTNSFDSQNVICYTQIYKSGIVEHVTSGILKNNIDKPNSLYSETVEETIITRINIFLKGLSGLDVSCPILCYIDMVGMANTRIALTDFSQPPRKEIYGCDILRLPEVQLLDYPKSLDDVATKLAPAIHTMWNAYGMTRSSNFDNEDQWARSS